jgi:dTDP-4-dehydrorhamnose reductase
MRTTFAAPEIWAGVECTVNRLRTGYHDQIRASGHEYRLDDLDKFAELGIRTMRVPMLWERVETTPGQYDWTWADAYMERLLLLGITPVLGLLHHGSGPSDTDLLDPAMPERFAAYAGMVAARYPYVISYTPINEPLTTARFSGLYGHWYPHHRSDASFLTALVNQLWATVLALERIKAVVPHAQLVQTEDLGEAQGDAPIAYQVAFENDRRWLTWDLLTGRVGPGHPLWNYLAHHVGTDALWRFVERPCPPSLIGINHYVESDRYLTIDSGHMANAAAGGNGIDEYADIAAVRNCSGGKSTFAGLLGTTWERYGIPVALTEVQLTCTREEQMRWLHAAWEGVQDARAKGVEVKAMTAWGLLGHFDWDSLLTRLDGSYAPGVFDIRSGQPRPTALAPMLSAMANGEYKPHPVVQGGDGWWSRIGPPSSSVDRSPTRPVLITGATGTLGKAFARICERRGIPYVLTDRATLDITDNSAIRLLVDRLWPWAVVNTAAVVDLDLAEQCRERCMRTNADGAISLARECATRDIQFLTFSTDQVFDGTAMRPYQETDATGPLNIYGTSKLLAEQGIASYAPGSLIVRTSSFFGPWDVHNFIHHFLRDLRSGDVVHVSRNTSSPTYVPDLVDASLDLLLDQVTGIRHLTNAGAFSWHQLAELVVQRFHAEPSRVSIAVKMPSLRSAQRPVYSALGSAHGRLLPTFEHAFDRLLNEGSFNTATRNHYVPQ